MKNEVIYDYIVVGSGCTGVQAAQTLIENGFSVLMLDVGTEDSSGSKFPDKTFSEIRKNDYNQSANFLGKRYEGIPWGEIKSGYHLTPARKYVAENTEKLIPSEAENAQLYESLAKGGLGASWGAGSYLFDKNELGKCGLNPEEMDKAYATIFSRIGVTEGNFLNNYEEESPIEQDKNINYIVDKYSKEEKNFAINEITVSQTPLAVITKDKGDRKGYKYRDMDFWDDNDLSAYRPWITLNELLKSDNFTYIKNQLVTHYKEFENESNVFSKDIISHQILTYTCKKIILSASVFGTTRIVLRSNLDYNHRLLYLCNSYYYIPSVNLKMLGKSNSERRTGFSQLSIYMKFKKETFVASIFTYRSLLLFKLIKESPLNFKVSRMLFKFLQSSFVIVGFHIPKSFSDSDYIMLKKDSTVFTNDKLHVFSGETDDELIKEKKGISKLKKALRMLNCFPLKSIKTPKGSSIHYAGTLPFSESNKKFTTNLDGKLAKSQNVFIVDASSFAYLPAKGVTLTAMANAHRVALNSLKK